MGDVLGLKVLGGFTRGTLTAMRRVHRRLSDISTDVGLANLAGMASAKKFEQLIRRRGGNIMEGGFLPSTIHGRLNSDAITDSDISDPCAHFNHSASRFMT